MPDYVFKDDPFGKEVILDPPAAQSTVAWSVLDATNWNSLVASTTISNPPSCANLSISIPSGPATALAVDALSAVRILRVTWASEDGNRFQRRDLAFTVVKPFALVIGTDEVRALIGFNAAELPDGDIDLVGAAIQLRDTYGESVVTPSLDSQRLMGLQAILMLKPSLKMRVAESMSSDSVAFRRFGRLDLDAVFADIQTEYDRLLGLLAPDVTAARTPAIPDLFGVATRSPDAVTG